MLMEQLETRYEEESARWEPWPEGSRAVRVRASPPPTDAPPDGTQISFEAAGMRPVDGDDGGLVAFEERLEVGRRIVEVAAEHRIEIPPPFAQ